MADESADNRKPDHEIDPRPGEVHELELKFGNEPWLIRIGKVDLRLTLTGVPDDPGVGPEDFRPVL